MSKLDFNQFSQLHNKAGFTAQSVITGKKGKQNPVEPTCSRHACTWGSGRHCCRVVWGTPQCQCLSPKYYIVRVFKKHALIWTLHSRVEWFSAFFDFLKPTRFCWTGMFLGVHFQKITRKSKIKYFLENLHKPFFYKKEQ